MVDLLQKLWDEFSNLIDEVEKAYPDDGHDCLTDTKEMAKLRKDLYDVGIKNIPGFNYD